MLPIVYELSTGRPLLIAMVALAITSIVAFLPWRRNRSTILTLAILCAIIIAASSPPVPRWSLIVLAIAAASWLITTMVRTRWRLRLMMTIGLWLALAIVALHELPWLAWRSDSLTPKPRLIILGDSVAAGIGGVHEKTWPHLLHERRGIDVLNLGAAGARLRDALDRQAPLIDGGAALVLLEIGGNDMLSRVPLDRFESELAQLIEAVRREDRHVVMFELPTPPLHSPYARIQRRLARRYAVTLIPRHHFVSVIAAPDATSDGVHLSAIGHEHMADLVDHLLGPLLQPSPTATYIAPHTRTIPHTPNP